jgi:hypothetical protein
MAEAILMSDVMGMILRYIDVRDVAHLSQVSSTFRNEVTSYIHVPAILNMYLADACEIASNIGRAIENMQDVNAQLTYARETVTASVSYLQYASTHVHDIVPMQTSSYFMQLVKMLVKQMNRLYLNIDECHRNALDQFEIRLKKGLNELITVFPIDGTTFKFSQRNVSSNCVHDVNVINQYGQSGMISVERFVEHADPDVFKTYIEHPQYLFYFKYLTQVCGEDFITMYRLDQINRLCGDWRNVFQLVGNDAGFVGYYNVECGTRLLAEKGHLIKNMYIIRLGRTSLTQFTVTFSRGTPHRILHQRDAQSIEEIRKYMTKLDFIPLMCYLHTSDDKCYNNVIGYAPQMSPFVY